MGRKLTHWEKEQRIRDKERAACVRFAVFEFDPANRYRQENAVRNKTYTSRKLAEKAADRDYATGLPHVVRSFTVC